MKKLYTAVVVVLAALALMTAPTLAANKGSKIPNSGTGTTTLDACGYFVGEQTATRTSEYVTDGVTYHSEKGTWTGIANNYSLIPVDSLGAVSGTYKEDYTIDAAGNISGTESFHADSSKIDQTFSFSSATNSWTVTVTATHDLAFLTSDTNGNCYKGPVPRP
jgi:hypothetical protein